MLEVATRSTFLGGQCSQKLVYSLVECSCRAEGLESVSVFGIRTELICEGKITDKAEIEDITSVEAQAVELLNALCDNTVTPCTLKDVVEDYIVELEDEEPAFRYTAQAL